MNIVQVHICFTEATEFKPCCYLCTPDAAISMYCYMQDKVFSIKMYTLDGQAWKPKHGIYGFNMRGDLV